MVSSTRRRMLIVLGMHRSGTSATSGILHALGATAPRHPLPASSSNPKGFWESARLMHFHDRLLNDARSSWDDWRPLAPDWYDAPSARSFAEELPSLIDDEFTDATLMLVKDPRMCRLMPFWQSSLRAAGIDMSVVLTSRRPEEVASSLARRDRFSGQRSLLLWLSHVLQAEYDTRSMERVFVGYDDLLSHWPREVDRIGAVLDIEWPRHPREAAAEIDAWLDGSLRHHQVAPAPARRDRDQLTSWTAAAFDAIETLTTTASDAPRARAALDRIREEFEHSMAPFAEAVRDEVNGLRSGYAHARARALELDETSGGSRTSSPP